MARPRKLIPSYRKHKASGQAFVELNGRQFYCDLDGTKASKAEYDRLVMEWLASGRFSSFGMPEDGTTIMELKLGYVTYAKNYTPTTLMHAGEAHCLLRKESRPIKEYIE